MNAPCTSGWRLILMSGFLVGSFWLGSAGAIADDGRPYWICTDASGVKGAQDRPCENNPDAKPAGTIARSNAPVRTPVGRQEEKVDVLAPDFWDARLKHLKQIVHHDLAGKIAAEPFWVHVGAGLVFTSLAGWFFLGSALPRIRRRRRLQAEARSPDLYKKALTEFRKAEPAAAVSAVPPDHSRWSKSLVEALTPSQLMALAEQLFVARSISVERSMADESVFFLKKKGPGMPRYGVVLCRAEGPNIEHGSRLVRELLGLMSIHELEYGALVAPGQFNSGSRDSARGQNVELKGSQTLLVELESLSDEDRRNLLSEVLNH